MAASDECKLLRKIFKKCPLLFSLFCTEKQSHKKLKIIVGFVYGILLGIAFYNFILIDLNFTEEVGFIVGSTVCLMLGFGIASSSQIRCIISLTYPTIGGKVGRGVLKAVVITFIIAGPVENLGNNGKEVVRVFACTTSLTFNLTKTRFELMFKPFTQAIFGMKTGVDEIKDTVKSIKDVSAPVIGEIEDEKEVRKMKEENDYIDELVGDTKRSELMNQKYETVGEQAEAEKFEKMYMKKIEMRCQNQFTKAAQRCRKMFASAYDKCYDAVTWLVSWLLCWPMKLDFICNIGDALGGTSRCDPSKELDPGFGDGYVYLKSAKDRFSSNLKDVKLQYKIGKIKKLKDLRDAKDTAVAVMHEINRKKYILFQILTILKRLLAFIFLRIILESQKYHDRYLRDIEFDNIYITRYFRKIDARRRVQEKYTLLPLKKIERKKLVDPRSVTPLKKEREKIFSETAILLLEVMVVTILVLLDWMFYESLDLIRRHARIEYLQTGHHDLQLQVVGTGMIAQVLRSIIKGFNVKKRIRIKRTNEQCLPRPNKLSKYYLLKIYGIYFAVWCMMVIQAYILRLRRAICAYFYRKREKKRVLFLYNESLKRRIGFSRFMKKKVKQLAKEKRLKDDYNVCAIIRMNYPNQCDWLRFFACARRKCLLCEEPEPRNRSDFVQCENEYCLLLYCEECWTDMGKECLRCQVESEVSSAYETEEEYSD
ncbi:unnamed protein product [Acanthoscelides obtectus]|uniref:Dendritic cell-specific transmembrane protein-like domain-containing protein n=1 Tax=Acanthoscelides obtectus TaxID=200917 RepID=A0A9P0PK71_ACAOB|nr:unnamed protein product [Acanthoscelides obtectus]CAK1626856.1 E3 ubiquitin-protein ligase DCST1 [Acanthoscelides obtectus]